MNDLSANDIKFHCDQNISFASGFLVRSFSYRDYSIEIHNHDFYEVNIVLSGTGIHCIGKSRLAVRTGDVFVIPPMVAHAYVNTEMLEVHHIILHKDFVSNNLSEATQVKGFMQLMEIEPFLRGSSSNRFFLQLTPMQLVQLKNELYFLDDAGPFSWEDYSIMKYHTMWKLLYWFSGLLYIQLNSSEPNAKNKYEHQVLRSLEYMFLHYADKITIDELCKTVFLSRPTYLRSFQAVCGTSPIEYLNNYRCKKALELLDNSLCSKTEVAHCCGFYDLSHMERTLKKYMDATNI